ncbi:MAG: mannose-6-phosphate isomerase [Lachnospiraceae bacterium]|nr:mannose-6-phosphate isomerase [Lachnospiraceae bacterium]
MKSILSKTPFRLDSPRAWRTYLGGALLDELHGIPKGCGEDGHFPEEWVMSVVAARNAGREDYPGEGLSHIFDAEDITLKEILEAEPEAILGEKHVRAHGAHPGVLVKLIDSAERLTIQVHPDRQTAKAFFASDFGKTECWHILGGREIEGQKPGVYLGFKEGITGQRWQELFDKQDIAGMLECLHYFEVNAGDTILIEGGVPHAIGQGCFLVEIQEPTDYSIRVERTTPSGFRVADEMCHQGIGFEKMFECFHYEGLTREETHRRWFLPKKVLNVGENSMVTSLVSYEDTPFFAMREIVVTGMAEITMEGFSGLYALEGKGILHVNNEETEMISPAQYFIPAGVEKISVFAEKDSTLRMLQFFGPCN